jgi:hypothetical protein
LPSAPSSHSSLGGGIAARRSWPQDLPSTRRTRDPGGLAERPIHRPAARLRTGRSLVKITSCSSTQQCRPDSAAGGRVTVHRGRSGIEGASQPPYRQRRQSLRQRLRRWQASPVSRRAVNRCVTGSSPVRGASYSQPAPRASRESTTRSGGPFIASRFGARTASAIRSELPLMPTCAYAHPQKLAPRGPERRPPWARNSGVTADAVGRLGCRLHTS